MGISRLLSLAAVIAFIAVLGIAYILLPESVWSTTSIAALLIFGAMTGFTLSPFFSFLNKPKGGDAEVIASVGPIILITAVLFFWSALTFYISLTGSENITWAMMIVSVTGSLITLFFLKAAAKVIDDAASSTASYSKKNIWSSQIDSLIPISSDLKVKNYLSELSEEIRFSASDIPDFFDPIDQEIDICLADLGEHLNHPNALDQQSMISIIKQLSILIIQRNTTMNRLRSKC